MKEKEFEEIGKRLYDLEADPPKDGWNKIGAAIAPPSTGVVGGFMWLSKHKKKFLFVVIPVSLYFMYPEQSNEQPMATLSVDSMYNEDVAQVEVQASEVEIGNEVVSAEEVEKVPGANKLKNSNKDAAVVPDKNQASVEQKVTIRDEEVRLGNPSGDMPGSNPHVQSANTTEVSKDLGVSTSVSNQNLNQENTIEKIEVSSAVNTALPKTESVTENDKQISSSEQSLSDNRVASTGDVSRESKTPIPTNSNENVVLVAETVDKEIILSTQGEIVRDQPGSESVQSSELIVVEELDSVLVVLDSLMEEQEKDSLIREEELIPESKVRVRKPWRVSGSFTPLFTTRTVLPIAGDEVLVTDVTNGSKQRIGSEFAIGAGKAITPQLYVDGQLLILRTTQDIQYTYSTGLVDTLIAVLQPDNSVLVKPVYQYESREIDAVFNSGGIRFGVTYYFFQSQRGRFNATVTGGVNYTMSSSIRERINDEWIPVGGNAINKLNYNLRLSAGYSMKLMQGWELMANPTMSYYVRESGISSLPYKTNQRSFGIMFMLSRTIGLK